MIIILPYLILIQIYKMYWYYYLTIVLMIIMIIKMITIMSCHILVDTYTYTHSTLNHRILMSFFLLY